MIAKTVLIPRKTPTQRRSQATVDAIIEATARVLVQEGYAGASTNRIARVAGVSVGSLYQYFPNKDALVMAVASTHADEMLNQLSEAASKTSTAPIPEVIRSLVHGMIVAHAIDPKLHKALVEQVLHLGMDHMAEVQTRARGLVRMWLQSHIDQIRVRNLDMAAYLLVTTVEAVVHSTLFDDPGRLQDPAFEDELVSMIIRYLLDEKSQEVDSL